MPPTLKQGRTAAVPLTHGVQPRSIQTSGIFRFPPELFLEVFSHLADHRRFIRENFYGSLSYMTIERKHAEQSVVIRRLTMTCWLLRNQLLPLLWTDVEGCISHSRYDYETKSGGLGSSPYAQCVYLSSTPSIAVHVRAFSVRLCFSWAPEDLMTKFIDCLLRLPNLKTLEILSVSSRAPISKALSRKNIIFRSIRELRITNACHHFIRKCPNLENLTFTNGLDAHAPATVESYGEGLKRIAGVNLNTWNCARGVNAIARGCPNLREIGMVGNILADSELIRELRQLDHIAVVDVELAEQIDSPHTDARQQEKGRNAWKRELISLLKDSPSTERKFLRWKNVHEFLRDRCVCEIAANEELEVFPETPL